MRTRGRVGLLVSVRNRAEAQLALEAGVAWIDIKEPTQGPLGAASAEVIADVLEGVGARRPLSAALGELIDWEPGRCAIAPHEGKLPRDGYLPRGGELAVKLGLAGCGRLSRWRDLWREAADRLPHGVRMVAVVYADWQAAGAPPPEEILKLASEYSACCRAVLVDTFQKDGRTLMDHWSPREVAEFCGAVRRSELLAVVAGSLGGRSLDAAVRCGPDLVAVRGAVCAGDRTSGVCPTRLAEVVRQVDRAAREGANRAALD